MTLSHGTRFGRYEILSPLGQQGVRELYLAQDLNADRTVALRILKRSFDGHIILKQRFLDEARVPAALSHRNIAVAVEAGLEDDAAFVASKFPGGTTLRQKLDQGKVQSREALHIAVQISSALVAAHRAGLIHRNLNPDSILLGPGNAVSVIDFGLAVFSETHSLGADAPTIYDSGDNPLQARDPYHSPEQARGVIGDARADVWGLGVILYEMLSGRLPFDGKANQPANSTIAADEPLSISDRDPLVSPEADQILKRALKSNRDERYQTASELLFDLRRLWRRIEVRDVVSHIVTSGIDESAIALHTTDPANTADPTHEPPNWPETGPQTGSNVEYIVKGITNHKLAVLGAAALLIIAIAIGSVALYKTFLAAPSGLPPKPFDFKKVIKLTTTGKVTVATISPDGKYVAHAVSSSGKQSLWIRQVATTVLTQVIPPDEVEYQGLSYSTDGNYVYYVLHSKNNPIRELYQMSVLGGAPRKLIVDIDSPVTFSPDGKRIAFVRRYSSAGEDALFVANSDGTDEKRMATRKQPDFFSTGGPAWSPDGTLIACAAGTSSASGSNMSIVGIKVDTSTELPISQRKWFRVGRVAWLKDRDGLIVNAVEATLGPYQLWHLDHPSGEARKITNDLGDYRGLSVAAEAGTIVTVQSDQFSSIWTADTDKGFAKAVQITSGKYDGYYGVSWTAEGKILYATNASGKQDVWSMDSDGTNQQQLTIHAGANVWPSLSADKRYIVFTSDRAGVLHIWRVNPDGSNPVQLTNGNGEDWAHCSADGNSVIYTSTEGLTRFTLWKVPIEGGPAVQLTDKLSLQSDISPDGRFVASGFRAQPNTPWKLAVIPIEGGQPQQLFDIPPTVPLPIVVRWTPDGHAVTYIDTTGGSSNIWEQPIAGGPPNQLTNFTSDQLFAFDWSPDGKHFVYSRSSAINDVVLISEIR